jgi:ABC-type transport system substrate-binding protein
MKHPLFQSLILALIGLLLLTGCNTSVEESTPDAVAESPVVEETTVEPTEAPAVEPTADSEPSYAEEIVIGIGRNLYYGHSQWHMIHGSLHVWEPLLYPDENLNPQPYLAESWESNEDLTAWTFKLKEGISFHDGSPLTAEVAVDNLMEIHENYTPLPTLDRMVVVDESTFTIYLTESTPALPDLLVYFQSAMLSPGTRDQEGTDQPVPYGTGPFQFVEYVDGECIVLERNENYWGEPPKVERIIYRYIPDAITRLQALHCSPGKSMPSPMWDLSYPARARSLKAMKISIFSPSMCSPLTICSSIMTNLPLIINSCGRPSPWLLTGS